MSLKQRTVYAVKWTALSALVRGALQLLQLMTLSRVLVPTDFGLVATAAAVISIGSLVSDLGLNSAYIQAHNVTEVERSSLYFLNLVAGIFLTLLFLALSSLAGIVSGDSRVVPLLGVYSLVFAVNASGIQLRYDAEKKLNFRPIALIEIFATSSGVSVAIISATLGKGAMSMVFGVLTAAIVNACSNWVFLANGWRPLFTLQLARIKRFIGFGFAVIGNGIVTQLSTNMDMLIGARLIGATQLGLYAAPRNLFMQLLTLINPIVTRVGFPLVSQIRSDKPRVARLYQKALEAISGLSAPVYLGAAAFADPLVVVVLGDQWIDSVPAFRMLAGWAFIRSMMNPLGSLLYGMGRPGLGLKWNIVQLGIALSVLPFANNEQSWFLALLMLLIMLAQLLPAWYFIVKPLCNLSLWHILLQF